MIYYSQRRKKHKLQFKFIGAVSWSFQRCATNCFYSLLLEFFHRTRERGAATAIAVSHAAKPAGPHSVRRTRTQSNIQKTLNLKSFV